MKAPFSLWTNNNNNNNDDYDKTNNNNNNNDDYDNHNHHHNQKYNHHHNDKKLKTFQAQKKEKRERKKEFLFLGGGHGSLRYCSIELFSSGNSVILIVMCGIAVLRFWLTVFGKGRSFTVFCGIAALFMCALLSNINADQNLFLDFILNGNYDYTFSDAYAKMKLVGHPTTGLFNRCIYQFEVFPCRYNF